MNMPHWPLAGMSEKHCQVRTCGHHQDSRSGLKDESDAVQFGVDFLPATYPNSISASAPAFHRQGQPAEGTTTVMGTTFSSDPPLGIEDHLSDKLRRDPYVPCAHLGDGGTARSPCASVQCCGS
jgi:hypothetical protein